MPGPGVYDAADLVLVTVGEHLAPVHRPKKLEELLALISIPHSGVLPENISLELTVLFDNVITGSRVLGQTLREVWLSPSRDGATGGEVGILEEVTVLSV